MRNLVEFKPHTSKQNKLSDIFRQGKGKSYGVEFFLEKKIGNITGWFGYTLSWTKHLFKDLNGGKEFPARHDRRHDLKFVMNGKISAKWSFNVSWIYTTGQPYTAIVGVYDLKASDGDKSFIPDYSYSYLLERNALRLPAYHRMDVSFSRRFNFNKWSIILNLQVFNVYSHRNAIGSDQNFDSVTFDNAYFKLLPIVPTISLDFEF
jgi:hypothetical protein